jgi:hypothetical protein
MVKGGRNVVKKKKQNIDGNTFVQDFDNLKFVQEYTEWKENCLSISGESIGVKNIPTLWDFLIVHVFENIRDGSKNKGRDGEGAIEALEAIEKIIEERVLTPIDILKIKKLATTLKNLQTDDGLNPKDILFTEKTYDKSGKVSGEVERYGHYRTDEYVARRKAAGKDDGLDAVPSGWYSGTGNPPFFALFGGNTTYAKPRSLVKIMEGVSDTLGKKGEGVKIRDLELVEAKGRNIVDRMSGIRGIERYFDQVIKKPEFWNEGGKLLVSKLNKDFMAQEFKVTPREQSIVRNLAGLGTGKDSIAGTIMNFRVKQATALPVIDLVNAALVRAGTKKAPNGYRAWQNSRRGGFDYRKTRREKFGEDVQGNPKAKVISKSWQSYLWR